MKQQKILKKMLKEISEADNFFVWFHRKKTDEGVFGSSMDLGDALMVIRTIVEHYKINKEALDNVLKNETTRNS